MRLQGLILWDFIGLTMSFWYNRKTFTFTRVGSAARLTSMHVSPHSLMDALLDAYSNLVAEPRGLPPPRRQDHRVHLPPNTAPILW